MSTALGSPLAVRLPSDLRERIATLAKATRRSQGDVVRQVLERDLGRLEWETRIAERAAAVRAGLVEPIPDSEVRKELGLPAEPDSDALSWIS